jgi:hypothetical protein
MCKIHIVAREIACQAVKPNRPFPNEFTALAILAQVLLNTVGTSAMLFGSGK